MPASAPVDPSWWTSGVWEGRSIREYLQRRDVAVIFRFLHACGIPYGGIAALVGVSPNRAAEIAKGVRKVAAYEVLERIAVGLWTPRILLGLGQQQDVDAGQRDEPGIGAEQMYSAVGRTAGKPSRWLGFPAAGEESGIDAGFTARIRDELEKRWRRRVWHRDN